MASDRPFGGGSSRRDQFPGATITINKREPIDVADMATAIDQSGTVDQTTGAFAQISQTNNDYFGSTTTGRRAVAQTTRWNPSTAATMFIGP
jgi:hypothetical protein